jgi:hypothetical protein
MLTQSIYSFSAASLLMVCLLFVRILLLDRLPRTRTAWVPVFLFPLPPKRPFLVLLLIQSNHRCCMFICFVVVFVCFVSSHIICSSSSSTSVNGNVVSRVPVTVAAKTAVFDAPSDSIAPQKL